MAMMYLMCLLPVVFGGAMWLLKKSITWWEWVAGVALAFAVTGIVHGVVVSSMLADTETWSGHVVRTTHHPYWHEHYTTTHHTYDSKGNITGTYVTHHNIDHRPYWDVDDNLGGTYEIPQPFFNTLKVAFGNSVNKVRGHRPNFDHGDRSDYVTPNQTGHIEPVHVNKHFENRVKAAPSVFSYAKVADSVKVYAYPHAKNWNVSQRVLGTKHVGTRQWDEMNARLGPSKKVNVIICAFPEGDSGLGQYQEAKWVGGKKNDVVLCYGQTDGGPAAWSYVFGWTDQEIVKRNLESILLEHDVNTNIIPLIEKEIVANYIIKDWDKFDYITLEPPGWCYTMLFFIILVTQVGFYIWAHANDFHGRSIDGGKPERKRSDSPWRSRFRRRRPY